MDKESEQYKSLSKVQKAYYDGYDDGWAEALLDTPKNTIHNSDYAKYLESLKEIEDLCDNTNSTHEEIWRIAHQHFA